MGRPPKKQKSADVDELTSLPEKLGVPPNFIKNFKENDVTSVRRLTSLNENHLKLLIPEEGPRSDFIFSLNLYKKSEPASSSQDTNNNNDDDNDDDEGNVKRPVSRRRKQPAFNIGDIHAAPEINSLHAYLKKSVPGSWTLAFYKSHGHLDHYTRDHLCQQTIYKELEGDYNRRITREEFDKIADSIILLFPTESKETWYDVVTKGKSTSVFGRLRNKYYSVRRGLVAAGLITKRLQEDLEELDGVNNDNEIEGADENDEDYQFLLSNHEPWPEVEAKWILLDAAYLEKSLSYNFKTLWRSYKKFLLTLLRQDEEQFLLGERDNAISEEEEFVRIWMAIPKLFKVRPLPKSPLAAKSSKCWRPSMPEIRDAFCLHINTVAEIQEKADLRKNSLETYKFPLTPRPVLVGPSNQIRQCSITLGDQKWEVDSPWAAVTGSFNMCFGLNSVYPVEARHVFLFLQRTLYNFQLKQDFEKDRGLKSFISGSVKDYELYCAAQSNVE